MIVSSPEPVLAAADGELWQADISALSGIGSAFSDRSNDLSPLAAAGKTDTQYAHHGDGLAQDFHLFPHLSLLFYHNLLPL